MKPQTAHRLSRRRPIVPRAVKPEQGLTSIHGLKLRITRSHPAWFLAEFSAEAKSSHMSQNRLAELVYVYWRQEMGRLSSNARRNTLERLQQALDVAYAAQARGRD